MKSKLGTFLRATRSLSGKSTRGAADGIYPTNVSAAEFPVLVGIAGGTASGKTSVVRRIVEELNHTSVAMIPQDCYYRPLSEAERQRAFHSNFNFDHPSSFEFDKIIETLTALKKQETVSIPKYCYNTHSTLPSEHDTVISAPAVVIFEGILALHHPKVRELLDVKIFVDTDADTRLIRRIRRDTDERGRDLQSVLAQYEKFVKPSFDAYISPQKTDADIIIPRGAENEVGISMVVNLFRNLLQWHVLKEHMANDPTQAY